MSASDPPELRLLRPLVLEAAGFLGYTQAMNTAGAASHCSHLCIALRSSCSVRLEQMIWNVLATIATHGLLQVDGAGLAAAALLFDCSYAGVATLLLCLCKAVLCCSCLTFGSVLCVGCVSVPAVDLVSQQAGGQADAVAPDVAKAVYALAAASGSDEAYQTLVNMYEQVGTMPGKVCSVWCMC